MRTGVLGANLYLSRLSRLSATDKPKNLTFLLRETSALIALKSSPKSQVIDNVLRILGGYIELIPARMQDGHAKHWATRAHPRQNLAIVGQKCAPSHQKWHFVAFGWSL